VDEFHLDTRPDTVLAATMDGVVELRFAGGAWTTAERSLAAATPAALPSIANRVRRSQERTATLLPSRRRRRLGARRRWVERTNIFSLAAIATGELPVLYAGTEPAISSAAPTAAADGTNSKRFAAFRVRGVEFPGAAAHRPREAYRRRPARAAHDLRFNRTGSAASQRR